MGDKVPRHPDMEGFDETFAAPSEEHGAILDGFDTGFAAAEGAPHEEYDPYSSNADPSTFAHADDVYGVTDHAYSAPVQDSTHFEDSTHDHTSSYLQQSAFEAPTRGYFAPDGTYVKGTGLAVKDDEDEGDEPLRQWQASFDQEVIEKNNEEKRNIAEREAAARKELEEFYGKRDKVIEMTQEANQVSEQNFIAERDAVVDAKNLWDRVTKLIDVSKGTTKDEVGRFRSLLLELKHHPI
eukprot:c25280_g1_i1.p1 GENE.c25280_g1_i1~~c25280_g1_i1.p1  ORF type:complete len:239 (-),score=48.09 c25280_g1_i1:49-765(-)